MKTRIKLPSRRPGITAKLEWGGMSFHVGHGFDSDGKVRELFLDGDMGRGGSNIERLADDFMIVASHCLQFGMGVRELADKLAVDSDPDTIAASTEPLSLFGAVLQQAVVIEKQHGEEMAGAYEIARRCVPRYSADEGA